tara:strand:- start:491 stop:661 length:171 start_codon:yes stop_codon:yes gene_type:complete
MNAPIRPVRGKGLPHPDNDPPTPEWMPTGSIRREVAHARREMGETRWQQLMAEWDA